MNETAIEIESVALRFGKKEILRDLSLSVPRGQTFAFLGRNGAGKTTTIRMLMGLLRPERGRIRVLGIDPQTNPLEVRRRAGYLAEDQRMFGWMKIEELLRFLEPFYPGWDKALAARFLDRFELSPKTRVQHLSKGQSVRLGLLLALAHRPELVILDDPTLGLDPIARKELLRDIIDHLQGHGVTVFFSSHLLYEIEPVADAVAILDRGHIVRQAATEELREQVKRLILKAEDYARVAPLPGALDVRKSGAQIGVVVERANKTVKALAASGIQPEVMDLNLDEIFEAYVIGKSHESTNEEPALERVA